MKKIAIHKSIDWIRKQKISFVELEPHWAPAAAEEPIDEAAFQFTMDAIAEAIESLPDNYRTIFPST